MVRIFIMLLLLNFSKGFCQLNDNNLNKKRREVYVALIRSLQENYNNVPLHVNIQSNVQMPNVAVTTSNTVTNIKDTLLVNYLKNQFKNSGINFTNKDTEIMLNISEIFAKQDRLTFHPKKILAHVYAPLDDWVNYFTTQAKKRQGKKGVFHLVYIPVKLIVWTLNDGSDQSVLGNIEEFIIIYVYNINEEVPLLKKIL